MDPTTVAAAATDAAVAEGGLPGGRHGIALRSPKEALRVRIERGKSKPEMLVF